MYSTQRMLANHLHPAQGHGDLNPVPGGVWEMQLHQGAGAQEGHENQGQELPHDAEPEFLPPMNAHELLHGDCLVVPVCP